MSSEAKTAPYGEWQSPITAELVSGSNNTFNEVHVDPASGATYLVEGRPAESGRCAIVKIDGAESSDVLPSQYNARSLIHEYGGGAAAMGHDGGLIVTDANTQGVFRLKSGDVQPIVEAKAEVRYGDFDVHPKDAKWVLAVQEVHKADHEIDNKVVVIDADAKTSSVLCEGADFYSDPKFSLDGKWISWVQWKHPDMPWTGSELYIATWEDGKIGQPRFVAGKAGKESVAQPKWHTNGGLLFSSDRTGFPQLYIFHPSSGETRKIEIKGFEDAEIAPAGYRIGYSTYIELNPETLVVAFTKNAVDGLLLVGIDSGKVVPVPLDLVEIQPASVRRISNTRFTAVGSKATLPAALYHFDVESNVETVLRSTTSIALPQSIFSKAEAISFPRTYGKDKTGTSHALFLPPHNPSFSAPPGAKPPLIVSIHGGPTGHVAPGLSLTSQYWTSRGFAYVYVNYAGSTGYGRAYIESLNTLWGVQDVDDAASCVAFLAEKGWVDGSRVGITGGSAGGYTVLQALCTYPKLWAAGNSSYGIGNLKSLADMTHKFESHYLFALVFPEGTPKEEQEKVYWERSPCHHAEKIESPLLLLQGALDRVVPLDQAEEMERVLKEGKKDVKLVVFEGEGHGFRMQKNVKRAIEEEESLWKRTLLR